MKYWICLNKISSKQLLRYTRMQHSGTVKIKHVGVAALGDPIPESIEIKGVFLSTKNPVVRLGLVIR